MLRSPRENFSPSGVNSPWRDERGGRGRAHGAVPHPPPAPLEGRTALTARALPPSVALPLDTPHLVRARSPSGRRPLLDTPPPPPPSPSFPRRAFRARRPRLRPRAKARRCHVARGRWPPPPAWRPAGRPRQPCRRRSGGRRGGR
eukprot:1535037-Pyramimonas_sp.AAC.1